MYPVEVSHVAKSFDNFQAVADVSFEVNRGEIFGLLGPNGAGKTTTIRLILDIFKPDRGSVSILDGPMTESKKNRIGYMPEERGLYQDIALEHCLLYLASLKDVPDREARKRLNDYLEHFDLTAHKTKKVKELSKGMQQKAQLINTLIHQPELVIVDEPFAGLDPVNVQLVKDHLREVCAQGATIIMSTHQMHQVEELCSRIILIHRGKNILYGPVEEIRRRFSGHAVLVRAEGDIPQLVGVIEAVPHNSDIKLLLNDQTAPKDVFRALANSNTTLEKFELAVPSLDEIFIQVVEGSDLG